MPSHNSCSALPTHTHTPLPPPPSHTASHMRWWRGRREGEAAPPSHSVHNVMNVTLLQPLKTQNLSHTTLLRWHWEPVTCTQWLLEGAIIQMKPNECGSISIMYIDVKGPVCNIRLDLWCLHWWKLNTLPINTHKYNKGNLFFYPQNSSCIYKNAHKATRVSCHLVLPFLHTLDLYVVDLYGYRQWGNPHNRQRPAWVAGTVWTWVMTNKQCSSGRFVKRLDRIVESALRGKLKVQCI